MIAQTGEDQGRMQKKENFIKSEEINRKIFFETGISVS